VPTIQSSRVERLNEPDQRTEIADLLYEVGHLKRTIRSGWALARMTNRESVADHSFRTAIIAMTMAVIVDANPDAAASIALLHDLPEARLGDMNHLTRRYLNEPKPFERIIDDQVRSLPVELGEALKNRTKQWLNQTTLEAQLAHDADILESILHIRESLADRPGLEDRWVQYLAASLKTQIAAQILEQIVNTNPDDWWPRAVTE
jgi:putative hydrolases of HD superfamily